MGNGSVSDLLHDERPSLIQLLGVRVWKSSQLAGVNGGVKMLVDDHEYISGVLRTRVDFRRVERMGGKGKIKTITRLGQMPRAHSRASTPREQEQDHQQ
jgi:hypothetical protein